MPITRTIELDADGWIMPSTTSVVKREAFGDTEIGDVLQPEFYPQWKLKRWDNDANLSVRMLLTDYSNPDQLETQQNIIAWRKANYGVRISVVPRGTRMDIMLYAQPSQNYLDFSLQTKNVVLSLQPPLTAREILDGHKRPDEIINSIAVYHSTRRHGIYETGKLCHLYRPQATDAFGLTNVFCDWSIVDNNTIRITCPQAFLNTAVYPVRIR